jgi:hypothetical protein
VFCLPSTPPAIHTYETSEVRTFAENASGRRIYVPRYCLETYKTNLGWSKYADSIYGYDF